MAERCQKSGGIAFLVPLYKGKGDVKECGSYRGVILLEHGMKVVERVLEDRLRDSVTMNAMQQGWFHAREGYS